MQGIITELQAELRELQDSNEDLTARCVEAEQELENLQGHLQIQDKPALLSALNDYRAHVLSCMHPITVDDAMMEGALFEVLLATTR